MQKVSVLLMLLPFLATALPTEESSSWLSLFQAIKEQPAEPKPCCFPEVWEGFVESNVGHKMGQKEEYKVSKTQVFMDESHKRFAGNVFCRYTGRVVGGFLGQFNQTSGFKMYIFSKGPSQKCFSFRSPKAVYRKTCIPEDAKFKGNFHLGLASSSLAGNSFSFYQKNKLMTLMGNAVVTSDCVPLVYREAGIIGNCDDDENQGRGQGEGRCQKKTFLVNAFFHDLLSTIRDHSVFNLPEACKNKAEEVELTSEEVGDEEFQPVYKEIKTFLDYVVV